MKAKIGLRDLPERYQGLIRPPRNKFGNKLTEYKGVVYHSAREASYAQELDWLVRAGQLKSWVRQVSMPLVVGGTLIARYVIDFVEEDMAGNKVYTEVKGYWTPEAKLKAKLFKALYPELAYKVVK
jgi:hypothetical protein